MLFKRLLNWVCRCLRMPCVRALGKALFLLRAFARYKKKREPWTDPACVMLGADSLPLCVAGARPSFYL